MTWLASEACVPSQLSNGGGTLAIGSLQGWGLSLSCGTPGIEGFQEAQASPEPLLSGSQATDREGQGWGPIAFLILPLPGWPGGPGPASAPSRSLLAVPLGAVRAPEKPDQADVCRHRASDPLCLGYHSWAQGSGCSAGM